MKDASGREKLFCEHQLRNCECELSEEIDTDHELDFESVREAESVATEENKDEEWEQKAKTEVLESSMNNSIIETILNSSENRSGLARCTKQTEIVLPIKTVK